MKFFTKIGVFWLLLGLAGCRSGMGIPSANGIKILNADHAAGTAEATTSSTIEGGCCDKSAAPRPLRIVDLHPKPASDAVLLDTPLGVTFNRAIQKEERSQIGEIWLEQVTDPLADASAWLPVTWEILGAEAVGRAMLAPETMYRWHLPDSLDEGVAGFFRTAAASSRQPVHLVFSDPRSGKRGVAPNGTLRVQFNRPVPLPAFSVTCNGAAINSLLFNRYRSAMIWESAAGTILPGSNDCQWHIGAIGRAITFSTRVALGDLALLAVNVDPRQDWSCSDDSCRAFCGDAGQSTVSTSDEYLVLVNGSDHWVDLRQIEIVMEDSTPESWVPDDQTDLCFMGSGTLGALSPGEIVVLGNPPGSMNNETNVRLYYRSELIDWLSIASGELLSSEHLWQSPAGGKAQSGTAEIRRSFGVDGGSYWKMTPARLGIW